MAALFGVAIMLVSGGGILPTALVSADTSLQATPKITFTFDDGLDSALTQAAPTLAKYGFTGTDYIITNCVGMTVGTPTTPNTCAADTDVPYMSWDNITALQNTYGWNIGSHTVDHPLLASTDPDTQPNLLTTAQIHSELFDSKAALATHGFDAIDFAAPYGDYNNVVLAEAAKVYATFRGFADIGYNTWPYNDRLIVNQQIQEGKAQETGDPAGITLATAEGYINTAIANNQWLTLTFHDIRTKASKNSSDYTTSTALLDQIAAYVKTQVTAGKISVVSPHDSIVNSSTNMFADGSFDSAISTDYQNRETNTGVWTTDDTTGALIHNDANGNGSFVVGNVTAATNSLYISATGADAHIWSPKVAVAASSSYIVKGYFNITNFTPSATVATPEVAYYVDEYDANGKVVSTQYQSAVRYDATNVNSIRVKNANFIYKPTSAAVVAARVYINVQGNGGITGYMDNLQMFAQTAVATKPGDANGDGVINIKDATLVSLNWGKTGVTAAQGDLNGDGTVNIKDATLVSLNWGK
jgi:peptidoglycan/xylan/chitin deacetylase (PgdA/CDA1 family)